MRLSIVVFILAVSACVPFRRAPLVDDSRGAVTGTVVDSTGQLLWGAQIRAFALHGPDSGKVVATITTPESGAFLLRRLPRGLYDLQVRMICFEPTRRRQRIQALRLDTVRVVLRLAPPNSCIYE